MDTYTADLVVRNARIYTLDATKPWATAMAVRSGRVIAVGDAGDVENLAGADTEVVDLDGRMVMPGIVDVHTHMLMGGQAELFELRFSSTAGIEHILGVIREHARKIPPGGWIVGGQWSTDKLETLDTAQMLAALDEASQGHPVILKDDTYHNRWVNSATLRLAGIGADTPDPPGGRIGRDAGGTPTGVMIESGAGLVERVLAESGHFTAQMDRDAMAHAIGTLNSFGVTAFLDAAAMESTLAALKGLDDRGQLTAWSVAAMPSVEPSFMFGISGDELFRRGPQYRSTHVRPDYVKFFLDGVPGTRTAAFHEPYQPVPPARCCCFCGTTTFSFPELVVWIDKCERQGLAAKVHCTGDAAVSQLLDAVEVVRKLRGPTSLVHHVAHASYIRDEDLPRFAALGVAADLSPFIWYPTTFLEGHKLTMGDERAMRFWPNRDLKAAGALMAGGSDWPVMPNPDPWDGIEGLVTRRNPRGEFPGVALWPEQALELADALAIFTINSARAMGLGDTIGSLEAGKSADFIVLERNLFEIPADDIADTRVLQTWFEGRKVYQRN